MTSCRRFCRKAGTRSANLGSTHKAIVSIDLGVQYVAGGRAQYLRPGSIRDVSDTQIAITPLESMTHMALIRIGVRIGL